MIQAQQITTRNPATAEVLEEYTTLGQAELNQKIERSQQAFRDWRHKSVTARAVLIGNLAKVIHGSLEDSAQLITREMGKSIKEARAEVEKCAVCCDFYAEHGPKFLEHETISTDASKSYVRFDPLGAVLAVMPWNFPFWQVLRFAAPTLLSGNVGLLKHASNVTGCALRIEELITQAGFPEGVFQTLVLPAQHVAKVIARDEIKAVSLTGSEAAGKAVAEEAGRHLKKLVLELGGSDAFIVLEDADLDLTVSKALKSRMLNAGQSCIAAKRFIVVDSVYDQFVQKFTAEIEMLKVGNPFDEATDLGPLARQDLVDELDAQVQKSIAEGARRLTGGKPIDSPGSFYAPTLLADITGEMTCFKEETFGPVACVAPVNNAATAMQLANASRFGLGGSIWSRDVARAEVLAAQLESGGVFINEFTKSDPRVPFGGVKDSGYGRELSWYGIREFVNPKTVWVG